MLLKSSTTLSMSLVDTNRFGLLFSICFILIIVGTPIDMTFVFIVFLDISWDFSDIALPGYSPPVDICIVLPNLSMCSAFKESNTITSSDPTNSDITLVKSVLFMFVNPSTSLYIL